VPVGEGRQGSSVALVRGEDALYAYVADADSSVIHVVDVDAGRQLSRTALGGSPREVLALADGRVLVTLADTSRLAVLEPESGPGSALAVSCARALPAEPWGLASTRDGAKIAVTSAWAAALTVLDGADLRTAGTYGLGRDPRGVLFDDDGRVWVSHVVGGRVSVLDLPKGAAAARVIDVGSYKSAPGTPVADLRARRTAVQGYALASVTQSLPSGTEGRSSPSGAPAPAPPSRPARRILVPTVSVDPGDPSRSTATYYGPPFDGVPKQAPMVSVIDPDHDRPLSEYLLSTDHRLFARECLLPRAAAVRSSTGSLFVACMGIDAVLELDAWALEPFRVERRRHAIPAGPTGIAIDDATARAIVFSQFDGSVTVLDLAAKEPRSPRTIALAYEPSASVAEVAAGRALFYRTDDARIANDGIACASCHPDGRDDGVTWATPEGPRQTLMLAGRLQGTAPYGWLGHKGNVHEYIANTVGRLGGQGIDEGSLQELSAFVQAVAPPPKSTRADELVDRGRALFFSDEQQCASCHIGGEHSDGMLHEVAKNPFESANQFETPSLRHVSGSGPWFHDGRYETLEDLLADPKSKMGVSHRLDAQDRAALAAFLRTL
jgi:DNA-binding beta-propeller fold protein YncE